MKSLLLAVGLVALVSLQGCCKKSEASPVGSSPDATGTASPVPVVETSKPQSQQRTYTMDRPGDGKNTYIRIKQIVVGPESTTVTVHLSNNTGTVMRGVSTSPPGAKAAFYIQRADHKKRFKLLRSEGIPVTPQKTDIQRGGTLQFTLVFEPIEPAMTVMDVYEGDEQQPGVNYWNFSDVKLE